MIVTVDELKEQLNIAFTFVGDDEILGRKIVAAQNYIERLLGFVVEDTYGGEGKDPVPDSLIEAVSQLAAHWYESREAVNFGSNALELPFSVSEIIREYRNWSF